ncbi:MAG: hypothetical protein MUF49_03275 [Oculatellaceae cyanobacterium Prado106]|jgi:hypothetical protein|nr:hypothetical protein [Oculatellaceae cyanobacterium Prado106]
MKLNKLSGVPALHNSRSISVADSRAPFWLLTGLAIASATLLWQHQAAQKSQERLDRAIPAISLIGEYAKTFAQPQAPALNLDLPQGWQTARVRNGVTSYTVNDDEVQTLEPEPIVGSASHGNGIAHLDGTYFPYVSQVRVKDLLKNEVAPGQYQWTETWEGEGYTRERTQDGQLIAEREGGIDIDVVVTYNATIKDPTKPNLVITIQNHQDKTGQLTDLSAFRYDASTGAESDRIDFEQLPPDYEVTVTRNGGFGGTDLKTMNRLSTVTFAYHVSEAEVKNGLSFKLQGSNKWFDERQQELYDLAAQGWVIKEVPLAN